MDYALAKRLKEAGYPQDKPITRERFLVMLKDGRVSNPDLLHPDYLKELIAEGMMVYAPTLEELIEACGDKFGSLFRHLVTEQQTDADSWHDNVKRSEMSGEEKRWKAGASMDAGLPTHQFDSYGHTPEEAVANLWLALNKKDG